MPLVVATAGQVWEFLVEGTADGGNTLDLNRLRWVLSKTDPGSPLGDATRENMLLQMKARWIASILPLLTDTYGAVRYNLQVITSVIALGGSPPKYHTVYDSRIAFTPTEPDPGQVGAEPNPDFVTTNTALGCSLVSRNTRGRLGLSPFADGELLGQTLSEDYRAATQAAVQALLVNYVDGGSNATWRASIFSTSLAAGNSLGTLYEDGKNYANTITSVRTSPDPGTQLHRKIRGPS
jgi:hypothetical protein